MEAPDPAREEARRLQAESESRLLKVFNSCPVALLIHDWHTRALVEVNAAFTDLLGWTLEELAGRTVIDVGIIDNATASRLRLHLTTHGSLRNHEIEVRTRRGDIRHVLASVELLELQRGPHALTTFIDITPQKQIAATTKLLSAIVESSDDAIIGKDLNSIVTSWNRGAERIFGYAAEEMIGTSITRLIPPDRQEEEEFILGKIRSGEGVKHFETHRLTRDGRIIDVSVTASPIRDDRGAIIGVSKIAHDVTERNRLERHFLRAQRLESIGTLAGGVAHDLNNVLAPILMAIEILRDAVSTPRDLQLLSTIQRSAERGAELVKQVLSFARGVEGDRVTVDVGPLARDLMRVMRDTFPKSIDVRLTQTSQLWRVSGDATQINQVLLNLCVNARDAMPAGGPLAIHIDNIVLDDTYAGMNPESRPGAYVVISVEDSGDGIPDSIRDRVFEPFFTTKDVGKGTGLGLSTTLAIVKSHGGFITLYSELGQGTTFKVYLPALSSPAMSEAQSAKQTGLPRGSGECVLVVDDEESVRVVAQRTLERFGYRVLLAAHGAEAVSLYAQFHKDIHVVLTDMAMPIMDGPALIVALKTMNPAVRIIGSSGLGANGGVAKAIGAGVLAFAPKPYTAETLLRTIWHTIHGPQHA